MKRWWWWAVAGVTGVGLVAIIVLLVAPKNPLPPPVVKQMNSTLFVPQASGSEIDRDSAKFDADTKLLSYNSTYSGVRMVISEQPTPAQMTEIPQFFDKFVDAMNAYDTFDVNAGTVHLTKPASLGGKQAAVLNSKGTLLFVKPDKDLSSGQWRKFFTHLAIQN